MLSKPTYNTRVIVLPKWRVFCFLSARKYNVIREWLDDHEVSAAQRAKFQLLLDLLESGGPTSVPGFISETPVARDIYKAKIKGNKGWIQLRPMLCKGPLAMDREFTFLFGAVEKDRELIPRDCKQRARDNRAIVIADSTRRRHEGVIGKPEGTIRR